ncbi:hypothetical protein HPB47_022834 [Ixodes persulcatus]|uniref:Uncharacterized protein n=1 Tax=Ixodes persulcatus TaxID=34615 RepID=A0AC60Q8K4_IXOPE|nr:hypothetical protein HPB47_022834 [Ixodes persulcatus]
MAEETGIDSPGFPVRLLYDAGDLCAPTQYTVIDDFRRHPDYTSTSSKDWLCDRYLVPGWYRFQVNGSNAIVPTFCPNVTRCGTQAPIWIRLNDPMPSAGQEVVGEACAAWIFPSTSTAVCCILKSPAKIRNCGTYLIYHIRGLTGCNLAFCALPAETRAAPKLAGLRTLSRLIIRPSLRGGASWLTCSASAVPGMLYNVSWYKHPARYKRVLLKDLRELDHPTDALLVSSVILGTEVTIVNLPTKRCYSFSGVYYTSFANVVAARMPYAVEGETITPAVLSEEGWSIISGKYERARPGSGKKKNFYA